MISIYKKFAVVSVGAESATISVIKKLLIAASGVSLIALGSVSKASAITIIDTCVPPTGCQRGYLGVGVNSGAFGPFGEFGQTTAGQTFVVPDTDNIFTEFSFAVSDTPPGTFGPRWGDEVDVVDFRAFVMEWDDIRNIPIGSILFESETRSTTIQNSHIPMEEFIFSTGGINLIAGNKYVAFLSVLKDLDGLIGLGWFGDTTIYSDGKFAGPYPDGDAVYTVIQSFDSLTNFSWVEDFRRDATFKATFVSQSVASVPEPSSTLSLLALGTLGAASTIKRKQKK